MKTVYFDIDTQIDFLFPSGSLYVPGAQQLIPSLHHLNHHAAKHGHPLVSTMCAHTEDDPEFKQWPPHCVVGTMGQLKPAETLREKRTVIGVAPGDYRTHGAQQILFEKNQLDITTSPNFRPLVTRLSADRYVVYGVVTEFCVRFAALPLLQTAKPIVLHTDAIQTLRAEDSAKTLSEFAARSGHLATVSAV